VSVRFLGQPIGSATFTREYLLKAAETYATNLQKLRSNLSDHHTQFLLLKSCAQPSLQHLLISDICYNHDPDHSGPLHSWQSPFQEAISAANADLLAYLGNTPSLDPLQSLIAHHPVHLGGFGVRDHARAAKTAYVASLTRSLRYATDSYDHLRPLPTFLQAKA
jgi:hypothetical protein